MKLDTLDLHLTRHSAADEKVRSFLNFAELPARIITGKSQRMRKITISIVQEYGYNYDYENSYNFGALIINENSLKH
tara:strand:+ start:1068 stop:1298 length:231 start_codon:yes stop_codon:yes gene_type:complete